MKKFLGYAVVFAIGVEHGRLIERVRNIKLMKETHEENKKRWTDRMDTFLSEES